MSEPMAELTPADLELLRRRAARYSRREEGGAERVASVMLFARGQSRFGVPLEGLREICPLRGFCPVPGASAVVPGVIHHRGELLSLHDLEAFIGGQPGPAGWVLVAEHANERLGLLADEVLGVEPVTTARLGPVPVTLGERAACFSGALDASMLLAHPAALFSTPAFFASF